jgi:hypothetical protein
LRSLPEVVRASPSWSVALFAAVPAVLIVLGIIGTVSWGEVALYLIVWSAAPVFVTRNYERRHGAKPR